MKFQLRIVILISFILFIWQSAIWIGNIPNYFLPTPWQVLLTLTQQAHLLVSNALITLSEALCGLMLALLFGTIAAIIAFRLKQVGALLMPILVISQALPTFAIAPLLVLWFGYGFASKIILIVIILFFPVTAALLEGLRQTPSLWVTTGQLMASKPWPILWHIQLPAALPHFASGVRIASAGAMMGAIVGEWVGSNHGLGFLLLEANARLEANLVFADLLVIVFLSLVLYKSIDYLLKRWITW